MEQISISKFKATCPAVLKRVSKTRKPVQVTRFGVPVAEIVPPTAAKPRKGWMGAFVGKGEILGDIVGPTGSIEDWKGTFENWDKYMK